MAINLTGKWHSFYYDGLQKKWMIAKTDNFSITQKNNCLFIHGKEDAKYENIGFAENITASDFYLTWTDTHDSSSRGVDTVKKYLVKIYDNNLIIQSSSKEEQYSYGNFIRDRISIDAYQDELNKHFNITKE